MFDYLMNYGVKNFSTKYEEVDINDRLALQDQINEVRKNYFDLLALLDDVQSKYLECTKNISKRTKELIAENVDSKITNSIFSSDIEYIQLESQQQALKAGMSMINNQIDYYKNDLRILNSVFYNKF